MEVRVHLHNERRAKRVAILVGKEPHCLRRLVTNFRDGALQGQIAGVWSNHADLEPIATQANLPFAAESDADLQRHFDWLLTTLQKQSVDLLVLARYMRILPQRIVSAYRHRIINIHPSLLPYFPGAARISRRMRAAYAFTDAPPISSRSNWMKDLSSCRTSFTSMSARIQWTISARRGWSWKRGCSAKRCSSFWTRNWSSWTQR